VKTKSDEDLRKIIDEGQEASIELNKRLLKVADSVISKINEIHTGSGESFNSEGLIYAAKVRCACGSGMAYPDGIGPAGFWDCSSILLGNPEALSATHDSMKSFAMYSIKSEKQPSANGATTRPAKTG